MEKTAKTFNKTKLYFLKIIFTILFFIIIILNIFTINYFTKESIQIIDQEKTTIICNSGNMNTFSLDDIELNLNNKDIEDLFKSSAIKNKAFDESMGIYDNEYISESRFNEMLKVKDRIENACHLKLTTEELMKKLKSNTGSGMTPEELAKAREDFQARKNDVNINKIDNYRWDINKVYKNDLNIILQRIGFYLFASIITILIFILIKRLFFLKTQKK